MKILETERDPMDQIRAALAAEIGMPSAKVQEIVREILADVRQRGDEAVIELERKLDAPEMTDLRVGESEFEAAYRDIRPELLAAFREAKRNIEAFHQKQAQKSWMEMHDDFTYGQVVRPLDAVGMYVPAVSAPLYSTVFMTAIPAQVAGVRRLVMCSPPRRDGTIDGPMLVAAKECGVNEVYKLGGAVAVGAMAFGTATVPRVDKIVGPGNPYFIEAKRQVYGIVGIDQLAGPSEVLVLADDSADPAFIAADLLAQAEHAADSRCVLVTNSRKLADDVLREVKAQTDVAPRADCIRQSLADYGVIVIGRDMDECVDLANLFAPEHLQIETAEPWEMLRKVRNAGTIMVGHFTPVPLCDFAAGPNHTLPTAGTARFASALGVDDFIKKSGLLSYTRKALGEIAPTVLEMANAEGLDAHANTVRIRIQRHE